MSAIAPLAPPDMTAIGAVFFFFERPRGAVQAPRLIAKGPLADKVIFDEG